MVEVGLTTERPERWLRFHPEGRSQRQEGGIVVADTPSAYFSCLYAPLSTADSAGLTKVLAALEHASAFAPTHWGTNELSRRPYDRSEAVAEGIAKKGVYLWRTKAPKYSAGGPSVTSNSIASIDFEHRSGFRPSHSSRVLAGMDDLVATLAPEYAYAHPGFVGLPADYYSGMDMTAYQLWRYGPCCVHGRTWLGAELRKRVGEQLLSQFPNFEPLSWGGCRFDLVPSLLEASSDQLLEAQRVIHDRLLASGVFGRQTGSREFEPGPKWKPPDWNIVE